MSMLFRNRTWLNKTNIIRRSRIHIRKQLPIRFYNRFNLIFLFYCWLSWEWIGGLWRELVWGFWREWIWWWEWWLFWRKWRRLDLLLTLHPHHRLSNRWHRRKFCLLLRHFNPRLKFQIKLIILHFIFHINLI